MVFKEGQQAAPGSEREAKGAEEQPCGLCGRQIENKDLFEYIAAVCTLCGPHDFHLDCVQKHLQEHATSKTNSILRKKIKDRATRRPQEEFANHKCPVGVYLGYWVGRGSGKRWEGPNCHGKIQSAEWVKPRKSEAAPPATPIPTPAQQQQQQQRPKALPSSQKKEASAAAVTTGRGGKKAPMAATASLLKANNGSGSSSLAMAGSGGRNEGRVSAGFSSAAAARAAAGLSQQGQPPQQKQKKAQSGNGSQGKKSKGGGLLFPPGAPRPPELRMCRNYEDYGDCHVHNCPFAHGPEELAEREVEWKEEQARKKSQKQEEERLWKRAALENHILDQQAFIPLSEEAFDAMKEYKLSHCTGTLLEMGFSASACSSACKAAGGSVDAAVQLLTSGTPLVKDAHKPVDVSREAEKLLEIASVCGFTAAAVEAWLLAHGGSWHAVEELMQEAALLATAQSSPSYGRSHEAGTGTSSAAAHGDTLAADGWSFGVDREASTIDSSSLARGEGAGTDTYTAADAAWGGIGADSDIIGLPPHLAAARNSLHTSAVGQSSLAGVGTSVDGAFPASKVQALWGNHLSDDAVSLALGLQHQIHEAPPTPPAPAQSPLASLHSYHAAPGQQQSQTLGQEPHAAAGTAQQAQQLREPPGAPVDSAIPSLPYPPSPMQSWLPDSFASQQPAQWLLESAVPAPPRPQDSVAPFPLSTAAEEAAPPSAPPFPHHLAMPAASDSSSNTSFNDGFQAGMAAAMAQLGLLHGDRGTAGPKLLQQQAQLPPAAPDLPHGEGVPGPQQWAAPTVAHAHYGAVGRPAYGAAISLGPPPPLGSPLLTKPALVPGIDNPGTRNATAYAGGAGGVLPEAAQHAAGPQQENPDSELEDMLAMLLGGAM